MAPYRVALIGTGRVGYQFSFSALPDNHAVAVAASARCKLVTGVNRGRDTDPGPRLTLLHQCE